jgi:hypothetical protein
MEKEIKYFTCGKHELERINEGLKCRNVDTNSVVSITDNSDFVTVWYKFKKK